MVSSNNSPTMMNSNGSGTSPTASSFQLLTKKRLLSKLIPITLVVLLTYNSVNNSSLGIYRQLKDENGGKTIGRFKYCNTPYVLMKDMATMPLVPPLEPKTKPSHVQLCEAYLSRHHLDRSEIEKLPKASVQESESICVDWTSPHYSVMNIFASSLIAAKGVDYGLTYDHKCHKYISQTRKNKDAHYDYTTVQEVLVENLISSKDARSLDSGNVEKLCRGCIQEFNSDTLERHGNAANHCFLFPEGDTSAKMKEEGKEIPFETILPSFVDRMRHMTQDWIAATDALDFEEDSGVIVVLDEKSTWMDFSFYDSVIPPGTTSIQILASPNCAMAHANDQSNCIQYGRALKAHFKTNYASTAYTRYDIVASTATSFARMMNVKTLICPPGTISCLLPALAKIAGKKAFVAEDGSSLETFHWFEHLIKKRKSLGLQNVGFDAVADEDFLAISEEASKEMPLDLPLDELDGDEDDDYTMVEASPGSRTRSYSFGPQPTDSQEPLEGEPIDIGSIISSDEEETEDTTTRSNSSEPEEVEELKEIPVQYPDTDGPLVDTFPEEKPMVDEFPDEPAYDENSVYGRGRSDVKDSPTGNTEPERGPDDESNENENSSDKELVPVYDFWHSGLKDHTFHLGDEWEGEEKGRPQYMVYAKSVEGTQEVLAFWHDDNNEFTTHRDAPWVGEIRSTKHDGPLFYAYPSEVEGLDLEPVYIFWHEEFKSHSFHMGEPWSGENENDGIAFYAFPVKK